jgi:tumor protein p53-inducible protein 3
MIFQNLFFCCIFGIVAMCNAKYMKAVVQADNYGDLSISESVPMPILGHRELLIKVNYTALNRMDLLQMRGMYPVPEGASTILGVEVSGEVVAKSPSCLLSFSVGDKVMALLQGGGYAEYCTVDERTVMAVLPGLDMKTAAAIPEAFMTAYQLMFLIGDMKRGESVLVHAAASSIGQSIIQMAKLKGIKVFVTSRSAEKVTRCLELGASFGVVVDDDNKFADRIIEANNGNLVDVILDPVGSSYMEDNLKVIGYDGRYILYGLLSGGVIKDNINNNGPDGFLRKLLFKRVQFLTSTLRARSFDYKHSIISALQTDNECGFSRVVSGDINVSVSETFMLEEVKDALQWMSQNKNIGKIVMIVTPKSDNNEVRVDL